MSETIKVPLSNGAELEIGEMSLQGWFLIKREVMSLLSDEASQGILSVILGEVQGSDDVNLDYTTLAPAIPRLIGCFCKRLIRTRSIWQKSAAWKSLKSRLKR